MKNPNRLHDLKPKNIFIAMDYAMTEFIRIKVFF